MFPDGGLRNCISDFLFTFAVEDTELCSRLQVPAWEVSSSTETWRLWLQPAGEGWKGYPFRSIPLEGWKVWLIGELYGIGDEPESIAVLLEEVILGRKSPAQLNGHFLIVAWHSLNGRLHVWTNRFGTLHAYYGTDGRRAAVGTFFPAVAQAASRRQLDWQGLTAFFSFGFFPQDRTYFEDVRILRPASHYVFDRQGSLVQFEPYWYWWHKPDPSRTYQDTVAEFGGIFKVVMDEQMQGGRIAIPISGGLDSRSTVAAITQPRGQAEDYSHVWAYSYGCSDYSIETRIARQVAAKRRLPFNAFTIKPYLFDRLDLVLRSVEGFHDLTQCRQAAVTAEIASRADYLIAAHWGDVWLDDMGLASKKERKVLSENDLINYSLQKMGKEGSKWLLEHVCCKQTAGETPQEYLKEMVGQEMAQVNHLEDQDFRIKAFKTSNWSFRWTEASLRMFQPGAFPRLPFYDNRIADFFCTVSSQFVKERRLQIDYLKQFAPDLAQIKWQVYDANLYHYQNFHTWLLPRRALKKAWRLLTRKQVIERNWEVQFQGPQGRKGLEHWLLRPGLKLHEYVLPGEVQALVRDYYEDPLKEKRGYTVSMLLTFSAWLEHYY
jgi:asparagine synthase (glutamine-hydrolysing)